MTRLEYCKKYGALGNDLGLIPTGIFLRYIRFQVYQNHIALGKSSADAIKAAAEECVVEPLRIYRAIYFFSKKG